LQQRRRATETRGCVPLRLVGARCCTLLAHSHTLALPLPLSLSLTHTQTHRWWHHQEARRARGCARREGAVARAARPERPWITGGHEAPRALWLRGAVGQFTFGKKNAPAKKAVAEAKGEEAEKFPEEDAAYESEGKEEGEEVEGEEGGEAEEGEEEGEGEEEERPAKRARTNAGSSCAIC
jgi:hypothetical protein